MRCSRGARRARKARALASDLCRHACTELRAYLAAVLRGQSRSVLPLHALLRELLSANGRPQVVAIEAPPKQPRADAVAAEQLRALRERLALLQSSWEQCAGGDAEALSAARASARGA